MIKGDIFVQDTLENLLSYIDDIKGTMMNVNGVQRPLQDLIDGFYTDVEKGYEIIITFNVKVKDTLDDIDVRSLINIASADDLEASAKIRLEITLEAHVESKPDKTSPTKGEAKLPLTGYVSLSLILGTCFVGLGLILVIIRRKRDKA